MDGLKFVGLAWLGLEWMGTPPQEQIETSTDSELRAALTTKELHRLVQTVVNAYPDLEGPIKLDPCGYCESHFSVGPDGEPWKHVVRVTDARRRIIELGQRASDLEWVVWCD